MLLAARLQTVSAPRRERALSFQSWYTEEAKSSHSGIKKAASQRNKRVTFSLAPQFAREWRLRIEFSGATIAQYEP